MSLKYGGCGKVFFFSMHAKVYEPEGLPTPESTKGSPKVNFPSGQWFSKAEIVSCDEFEGIYPLQHSGVVFFSIHAKVYAP